MKKFRMDTIITDLDPYYGEYMPSGYEDKIRNHANFPPEFRKVFSMAGP